MSFFATAQTLEAMPIKPPAITDDEMAHIGVKEQHSSDSLDRSVKVDQAADSAELESISHYMSRDKDRDSDKAISIATQAAGKQRVSCEPGYTDTPMMRPGQQTGQEQCEQRNEHKAMTKDSTETSVRSPSGGGVAWKMKLM